VALNAVIRQVACDGSQVPEWCGFRRRSPRNRNDPNDVLPEDFGPPSNGRAVLFLVAMRGSPCPGACPGRALRVRWRPRRARALRAPGQPEPTSL